MTTASPVAVGEILAEKYRVDRVLGEGGMGVVVAAHHLELDQPVAIKFLLDDVANSEEGAERFRREARAAARIQSDHVVRVLDVGVLPAGARYMVMEYLDGRDLSEELQARGQLGVAEAVAYVLEALDAIGQAHAAGIVHRDLKPANLYLARRADGSSRIKVLDFGISKSLSASSTEQLSLTRTSAWMGSPLYMAPEQMQSARDVDGRADIWSVGAILYELISGQPPYPAESLPQLCNLLLTQDPAPLSVVRADVPPEVEEVVMRCLARQLEARWQTVPELVGALLDTGVVVGRTSMAAMPPRVSTGLAATELGAATLAGAGPTGTSEQAIPARTAATSAEPGRTQGAWGRTNTAGANNGKTRLWLAGATLGALAAGGALLWASGSGADDEATSEAIPEATEAADERAPVGARPTPTSAAQPSLESATPQPGGAGLETDRSDRARSGTEPDKTDRTEAAAAKVEPGAGQRAAERATQRGAQGGAERTTSGATAPNTTSGGNTTTPAVGPKAPNPTPTKSSPGSPAPRTPVPKSSPSGTTTDDGISDFGGRR